MKTYAWIAVLIIACGTVSAATPASPAASLPDIALNMSGIPPRDFPAFAAENWRFFPLEWQTQPLTDEPLADFELAATVTIGKQDLQPPLYDTEQYCRFMELPQFHFQGGFVLRDQGPLARYRLQFSVTEKSVALWKTPGNFLAVADCDIAQDQPFTVTVRAAGNRFQVRVNDRELFDVVDRVAPLPSGHLLAGANHAHLSMRDMHLVASPTIASAPPADTPHVPRLAVRPWCGSRWIFDGAEPIARLAEGRDGQAWSWHPVALSAVKYRPGARAADVIPLQFRGAGNWPEKPMEILLLKPDTIKLRAFTSDRRPNKEPTVQTVCDVTLAYDAARDSYVYTLDNTMTYLTDRPAIVEIMDPWPYGVCGPAPHAPRRWDARYRDVIWRDQDEKLYRYPLNHFLRPPEPRLSRTAPLLLFFGEKDVNPTYEILSPSQGKEFKLGLCMTMLDMHVQYADLPKTLPAGTVQRDAWRLSSTHGADLAKLTVEPGWHPVWQSQVTSTAAIFDPRGTTFDNEQVVSALAPHHAQAFSPYPYYVVDPDVGHTAPGALRMDLTHGAHAVSVGEGLSYFGAAFDGTPRVLTLYVKTSELDGTFRVSITLPGNRVAAAEPLSGTTDGWRRVELHVEPQPVDHAAFINLEIAGKRGGKGVVWIDDVSFLPAVRETRP